MILLKYAHGSPADHMGVYLFHSQQHIQKGGSLAHHLICGRKAPYIHIAVQPVQQRPYPPLPACIHQIAPA